MLGCLGFNNRDSYADLRQRFGLYNAQKFSLSPRVLREGYYEQGMSPVFLSARIEPLLFYERKLKSLAGLKLRKTTFAAVIINSL